MPPFVDDAMDGEERLVCGKCSFQFDEHAGSVRFVDQVQPAEFAALELLIRIAGENGKAPIEEVEKPALVESKEEEIAGNKLEITGKDFDVDNLLELLDFLLQFLVAGLAHGAPHGDSLKIGAT
jgi:hypothetical protein